MSSTEYSMPDQNRLYIGEGVTIKGEVAVPDTLVVCGTIDGDVSAGKRYWARDVIEPTVETTPQGTIHVSSEPGFGYLLDRDYIRSITMREESAG